MSESAKTEQPIIAISLSDAQLYGCPHCGAKGGRTNAQGCHTRIFRCDNGCRQFCIVNNGLTKSGIGLGGIFPDVISHPLKNGTVKKVHNDTLEPDWVI